MAEVIPFCGILYNQEKINDLSKVTTPPYDVISDRQKDEFHDCHPNNVIRLILGQSKKDDTDDDNYHTRAGKYLNEWIKEGILVRDKEPAVYLNSTTFTVEGRTFERFGLIARVRLEPFEKGIVLPHERTFSKIKSERLNLMKASHANFSPIFSLYSDDDNIMDIIRTHCENNKLDASFTDSAGHGQKMWSISDQKTLARITDLMKEKTIFIADGHHRYETAIAYRDWLKQTDPNFSDDHPANYVMMYLSSIEDPGMVILPAHRILSGVDETDLKKLASSCKPYFHIESFPFEKGGLEAARDKWTAELKKNRMENSIGIFMKDDPCFYLLRLKQGVMKREFGKESELTDALLELDVTVLTRLIFMELLGFDQARLDNEKLISYSSREEEAVEAVSSGRFDVTFVLNGTRIEQVQRIAKEGRIMPRKSTYFYPKVITGQALNSLKR
ncbi:DUF1015 domain-containing protein [Desulfobacterales bacterium HSG16]|nr:DUF1015 domain-containing protein [Desulfobacterales bacterium HSG16]